MSLLRLSRVAKTYSGPSPVLALHDVDLSIDDGEYVAVTGPSGSGKSTLLNILALLDQPTEGTYEIAGEDVTGTNDVQRARLRSHWFAFVFQAFHLLESRSVLANVEMGLMYRRVPAEARTSQALEAIDFVGLTSKAETPVNKLSGGQRQRVAIARAIAAGAPVLVADEPTGSLDSVTSSMVMDVFEKLKRERGTSIVLVTHDPNVAKRAHRRIQVFDGEVSELGSSYTEIVDDPTTEIPQLDPAYQIPQDVDLEEPWDDGFLDEFLTEEADEEDDSELTASYTEDGEPQSLDEEVETPHELATHQVVEVMDDGRIGRDASVRFKDILHDAWASLTDYPKRTAGMVIAVALGVAMSLATLGIGQSASSQVSENFDTLRNTQVKAYSQFDKDQPEIVKDLITPTTLDRVRSLAGVKSVTTLVAYKEVKVRRAIDTEEISDILLYGAPDIPSLSKMYKIEWADAKRTFHEGDVLIGTDLAAELDLGPIALGPTVIVGGRTLRVAGLVNPSGYDFEAGRGAFVVPVVGDTMSTPSRVTFDVRTMPGAAQQVAEQLPIALYPPNPDVTGVEAPPDPETMREEIESNITTMLYTLTGVSIVAAIVALTNAMTTAVSRRTGEFGLRRAMGARRGHIATLVALESAMLGALGGFAGTALAILSILVVTIVQRWQPVFDIRLIPLGLAGGIVVGVFSSLAAMFRAAAIEPADALRR